MPHAAPYSRRRRASCLRVKAALVCCCTAVHSDAFVLTQARLSLARPTACSACSSNRSGASEAFAAVGHAFIAGFTIAALALSPVLINPAHAGEVVQEVAVAASQTAAAPAKVVPTATIQGEVATQFQKATNYGSVADFDKAYKLYNAVVKYAPGYVYGYSNRANVMIARGDLPGAIRDYSRALELAEELAASGEKLPDEWLIHLNRGTTYMATGQNELAMADLNAAVSLNPRSNLLSLANRAQMYERLGQWEDAVKDYGVAVSLKPGDIQPWWLRFSLTLYQSGRDYDAVAYMRRIAAKFGDAPEPLAALTAIAYGRGDTTEAERAWTQLSLVEKDKHLDKAYLRDQLKWPPAVVDSLLEFGRVVYNPKK